MGQYYHACIMDKRYISEPMVVFCPHEWDNGAKLMEHSYEANKMVIAFTEQLVASSENGACRAAWVGDYSNEILTDPDYLKTLNPQEIEALWNMYIKAWCLDVYEKDSLNRKDMYPIWEEIRPEDVEHSLTYETIAIANLDRKEYVLTRPRDNSDWPYTISRIALLLCFYNSAGGSYHSKVHADMVGRWAGQRLVAQYAGSGDVLEPEWIAQRVAEHEEDDGTGHRKHMDFSEFTELTFEFKEE